jgi:hypothetical protein
VLGGDAFDPDTSAPGAPGSGVSAANPAALDRITAAKTKVGILNILISLAAPWPKVSQKSAPEAALTGARHTALREPQNLVLVRSRLSTANFVSGVAARLQRQTVKAAILVSLRTTGSSVRGNESSLGGKLRSSSHGPRAPGAFSFGGMLCASSDSLQLPRRCCWSREF